MALQAPNLDDLRFQSDLVDEARKRIIHYCPEWTEYNLSDPGITMIELFSWMTELMVYRLNRVPERNYIKFLDMLGFDLAGAKCAETDITFWLSALLPLSEDDTTRVYVPAGTEIQSSSTGDPIVFSTTRELVISAPLLRHLRTEAQFNLNKYERLGLETFYPFDRQMPHEGDTFYLGFDDANDLSGHILQLRFTCEPTEAVGIRREDPPWVWECRTSEGWERVMPSTMEGEKDTTGGLNNPNGILTLYMPLSFSSQQVNGLQGYWIRCRIEQREPAQGMYTESPRVTGLEVYTAGAQVPAINAQIVPEEVLGESTGEPGQRFTLSHAPVLPFSGDEKIFVEELVGNQLVMRPWTAVPDFSKSSRFDRHYVLDTNTGTVIFGPAVRQADGTVTQYGRIPESGHRIMVSEYRYGGGIIGNLPENSIDMLNTSLAYISRASNRKRSLGGRDAETLQELIIRAQRQLIAQERAVTAEDFEQFALRSSRGIARARCVTPQETGGSSVTILLVPSVEAALESGNLAALHINDDTRNYVRTYLDKYRLLTTTLNVDEPTYYGISVKAYIAPEDFAKEEDVIREVETALAKYLSPLDTDDEHKGWEFGKSLFCPQLLAMIQQLPSVRYVMDAEIRWRKVLPVNENNEEFMAEELQTVEKRLMLPPDGLLCSLPHDIKVMTPEEFAKL